MNSSIQLAIPTDSNGRPVASLPVRIEGLAEINKIDSGSSYICVIDKNNDVLCWGGYSVGGVFDIGKEDPHDPNYRKNRRYVFGGPRNRATKVKRKSIIEKIDLNGKKAKDLVVSSGTACIELVDSTVVCSWSLGPNFHNINKICPDVRFTIDGSEPDIEK